MKKALKRLLVLVLVFCMSTIAFADSSADLYGIFSLDEILADKSSLKNSGAMKSKVEDYKNAEELIYGRMHSYNFSVLFGNYPQSGISEMTKEPIEWIILEKNDGRALLISKDILYYAPLVFGSSSKEVQAKGKTYSWETSDIRKWLNNEFYNSAFSSTDKQRIIPYDLTGDNVFILNAAEATSYFNLNDQSYRWGIYFEGLSTYFNYKDGNPWCGCGVTSYARNSFDNPTISKASGGATYKYHLRDGVLYQLGTYDTNKDILKLDPHRKYGIRPCVWIKYDPYARSAKSQTRENTYNKIGENIAGAALDYLIPGIGIFVP